MKGVNTMRVLLKLDNDGATIKDFLYIADGDYNKGAITSYDEKGNVITTTAKTDSDLGIFDIQNGSYKDIVPGKTKIKLTHVVTDTDENGKETSKEVTYPDMVCEIQN
jgi:hypothetical protein